MIIKQVLYMKNAILLFPFFLLFWGCDSENRKSQSIAESGKDELKTKIESEADSVSELKVLIKRKVSLNEDFTNFHEFKENINS